MRDDEIRWFAETSTAAAYASKTILTLYMAGLPVTSENAARVYGRWLTPDTPHFEALVLAIDGHIVEMIDTAQLLAPGAAGRG